MAAIKRLVLGLTALLWGMPATAQTSLGAPDPSNPHRSAAQQRPADLVVLREWQTMQGGFVIGVRGAKPDPTDATARTIVVWVETPEGVELAIDKIGRAHV